MRILWGETSAICEHGGRHVSRNFLYTSFQITFFFVGTLIVVIFSFPLRLASSFPFVSFFDSVDIMWPAPQGAMCSSLNRTVIIKPFSNTELLPVFALCRFSSKSKHFLSFHRSTSSPHPVPFIRPLAPSPINTQNPTTIATTTPTFALHNSCHHSLFSLTLIPPPLPLPLARSSNPYHPPCSLFPLLPILPISTSCGLPGTYGRGCA